MVAVLRLPDCWDRRFDSLRGHGFSCLVSVVCCVGGGFCDELICLSEGSYRVRVCVCVCVSACLSVFGASRKLKHEAV